MILILLSLILIALLWPIVLRRSARGAWRAFAALFLVWLTALH
jgi:hypothetical protein